MTARRIFFVLICLVILLVTQLPAFAQPGDPSGDPDHPVPITGIEYLLGGGIAYGIRSVLKARKK